MIDLLQVVRHHRQALFEPSTCYLLLRDDVVRRPSSCRADSASNACHYLYAKAFSQQKSSESMRFDRLK
jgi:hypothetical protein